MKKVLIFLFLIMLLVGGQVMAKEMVVVDSYKIIDAKPGQAVESSISVRNPADTEATVEIWLQDWKTQTANGKIVKSPVDGKGVLDQSLAPYLNLKTPTEITIPPKETKSIKFETDIPEDKKGTYWTAIVVAQHMGDETEEESDNKEGKDQVNVKSRAAFFSKIIRADSSDDNLDPWISSLSSPKSKENGLEFEATLENRGKVAFFFPSQITIYEGLDRDDNPIAKVDNKEAIAQLAPFYLFPGEDIQAKVNVPVDLPPGTYTAKLKILMERGEYAPVAWREFRIKE